MEKSLSVSECQTHKKGTTKCTGSELNCFFFLFAVSSFLNSNEVLFRINSGVDFDFEFEKPRESVKGLNFKEVFENLPNATCGNMKAWLPSPP